MRQVTLRSPGDSSETGHSTVTRRGASSETGHSTVTREDPNLGRSGPEVSPEQDLLLSLEAVSEWYLLSAESHACGDPSLSVPTAGTPAAGTPALSVPAAGTPALSVPTAGTPALSVPSPVRPNGCRPRTFSSTLAMRVPTCSKDWGGNFSLPRFCST